jgi:hypothetical protein
MERIEYTFDGLFETGGNISLAFFRRLAPFIVPAAPAFFFAYSLYTAVVAMGADPILAAAVGIIGALALITTGMLASHTAVSLLVIGEIVGAAVAGLFVVMYLVVEIGGILKLGTLTEDGRIAGVSISLITGAVYVTLSLMDYARLRQQALQVAEEKQQVAEDAAVQRLAEANESDKQRRHERDLAQLQHQQQMERDKLAAQERLELARIKAQASTEPAQSQRERAQASYVCQHCGDTAGKSGKTFRTQAALNAHQAHCPARQNGKVLHTELAK